MILFKILGFLLVAIHLFLAVWASGGMLEWVLPQVPWKPFSNPEFPRWLLFFHWATILLASYGFLIGYFTRWLKTPLYMTFAYSLMAIVCVIETFGYMTSPTKYWAMGAEYAAYILILILLYSSKFKLLHFQ